MKARVSSIQQARHVREVLAPVAGKLEEVEGFLTKELEQTLPMVRQVTGYLLGSGGKRLRPALLLLISKLLGYKGERDVRYAAIVELIHTATLIHDDIIDESDLRRGRPTANNRWGNQATVLVGDWLYTRTMALCLELGDVEQMRLLVNATQAMTEGELMADEVRGSIEIDECTYLDITQRKTAELFAAACALPALFQPSTLHFTEDLLEFGRKLGLSFQLVDDILDYTGSRSVVGKPVMSDLKEGRVTLPLILLLPRLSRIQREGLADVARSGKISAARAEELLETLRTSGVIEHVRQQAQEFASEARAHLERLPDCPEKRSLISVSSLLTQRTM